MEVNKVWADPVSLATTPRFVVYFPFLWVLRCFSSPAYLLSILYIQMAATLLSQCEVSPFGHPRFKACKAAPRGFSQPTTSFFGVLRQGILCARLSNFLRFKCNWLAIGFHQSMNLYSYLLPFVICFIYPYRDSHWVSDTGQIFKIHSYSRTIY